MRRQGAGPTVTKSGLVHVHSLVAPAEYAALKAEADAGNETISLRLRRILARRYRLRRPAGAARYQKRLPKSDA